MTKKKAILQPRDRAIVQARLYRAALEVSNEVQESLHAGENLDDIEDAEVIEVSVCLLRELRDAVGEYER